MTKREKIIVVIILIFFVAFACIKFVYDNHLMSLPVVNVPNLEGYAFTEPDSRYSNLPVATLESSGHKIYVGMPISDFFYEFGMEDSNEGKTFIYQFSDIGLTVSGDAEKITSYTVSVVTQEDFCWILSDGIQCNDSMDMVTNRYGDGEVFNPNVFMQGWQGWESNNGLSYLSYEENDSTLHRCFQIYKYDSDNIIKERYVGETPILSYPPGHGCLFSGMAYSIQYALEHRYSIH